MEPIPPARGSGRVIILNGASSSGKSTLAKALQHALDEPFLYVSSDQFVASGMLPERRDDEGPFSWWNEMRPRFFKGFHQCLPALAGAGNDLLVEIDGIHTFGPYDFEVDTSDGVSATLARSVVTAWRSRNTRPGMLRSKV